MRGQGEMMLPAVPAQMQYGYNGQGGNVDSRGLPLSVFGNQWGCCPPLFDKCTDDEVMMLFHGLDAVEPALRPTRRARQADVQIDAVRAPVDLGDAHLDQLRQPVLGARRPGEGGERAIRLGGVGAGVRTVSVYTSRARSGGFV